MNNEKKGVLNWLELSFILILIVISQFYNQSFIVAIFAIIMTVYAFFAPTYKIAFALLLLLGSAENLSFISSITIPTAIVLVYLIRYFFEKQKNKKKIEKWEIISILIIPYGLINYMFTKSFEQLLTSIKGYAFLVFISGFLESGKKQNFTYGNLYSISIRMVGIGLIISAIISLMIGSGYTYSGRFNFGTNTTTNIIGIQCATVVIALLFLFTTKLRKSIIDILILLLCSGIILLTMSKTALLMVLLGTVLILILGLAKKGNYRIVALVVTLSLTAYALYSYNNEFKNSVDKVLLRFSVEDISNDRYDLWTQTINKMNNNTKYKFFGAGDYLLIGAISGKKNEVYMAHNFLLETWVIYGYIGCFMIIIQYFLFIKNKIVGSHKRIIKGNLIGMVPVLTLMAGLFYSHHFIGRVNSILFIISFIPIMLHKEYEENRNETS